MRIALNGEMLCYEDVGSGPPLLLIHSLGTGSWLWREQMRHWAASHRVLAADMRGHGGTTCQGGITLEDDARDLAALMAELDLRDAVVVGLSMGGLIAAHLMAIAPERVRALVLSGTFCHQAEGAARIAGIEAQLASMDMATFGQTYADATLMPHSRPAHTQALAESIARTSKEAYLATVRSLFTQDTRPLLARVRQPVLMLLGEQDQRTPMPLSQEILSVVPHAHFQALPNAAHLANLDQPAAFQDAIDRFIALSA